METIYAGLNIHRLKELDRKISADSASLSEKDELLFLLYQNGSFSRAQYIDYLNGKYTEQMYDIGVAIARVILLGYRLRMNKFKLQ